MGSKGQPKVGRDQEQHQSLCEVHYYSYTIHFIHHVIHSSFHFPFPLSMNLEEGCLLANMFMLHMSRFHWDVLLLCSY